MKNKINNTFRRISFLLDKSEHQYANECRLSILKKEIYFRVLTKLELKVTRDIYTKRMELKEKDISFKNVNGFKNLIESLNNYSHDELLLCELRTKKHSYYIFTSSEFDFLISILKIKVTSENGVSLFKKNNVEDYDPRFHKFNKMKYVESITIPKPNE